MRGTFQSMGASAGYIFFLLLAQRFYCLAAPRSSSRARLLLLVCNLSFVVLVDPKSLPFLLGSLLMNFWLLGKIRREAMAPRGANWMLASVLANLILLFWPKAVSSTGSPFSILGLSYYSLQQIIFLIDTFEEAASDGKPPDLSLAQYASFVSFFPQLTAGPICAFQETGPQLVEPASPSGQDQFEGVLILARGFFQKVVIASLFSLYSNALRDAGGKLSCIETVGGLICAYLWLYFDFNGYSDIAVGSGLLFGVRMPLNFRQPLRALTLSDFWSRWHITLSNFVRHYLYYATVRRFPTSLLAGRLALVTSMVAVGLWHELSWRYLLFGLWHGLGLLLMARAKPKTTLMRWACWSFTHAFVAIWMVFVISPNLQTAANVLQGLTHFWLPESGFFRISTGMFGGAAVSRVDSLLTALAVVYTVVHVRDGRDTYEVFDQASPSRRLLLWFVTTCCVTLLFMNSILIPNFVYANF